MQLIIKLFKIYGNIYKQAYIKYTKVLERFIKFMVIGLDVGYAFTKDNAGHIFRSAYSTTDKSVAGQEHISVEGKNYYIGSGLMTSETDKTGSALNMACTLYDIMLNGAHDVQLCVGLPIGQYKAQKDALKQTILSYNKLSVWRNNVRYTVNITDVCVAMQGVAGLYTIGQLDGMYLIIDIGGYTIDTCLVEYSPGRSEILVFDTWYKGIRTLYADVVTLVNNKYNVALDNSFGDRILRNNLKINGAKADLSFIKPYLSDYVSALCDEIKLRYPVETADLYLTGGGAGLLEPAFRNRLGNVQKLSSPQFANAKGYYIIGSHKFGRR